MFTVLLLYKKMMMTISKFNINISQKKIYHLLDQELHLRRSSHERKEA
jgi:hypothetical protein